MSDLSEVSRQAGTAQQDSHLARLRADWVEASNLITNTDQAGDESENGDAWGGNDPEIEALRDAFTAATSLIDELLPAPRPSPAMLTVASQLSGLLDRVRDGTMDDGDWPVLADLQAQVSEMEADALATKDRPTDHSPRISFGEDSCHYFQQLVLSLSTDQWIVEVTPQEGDRFDAALIGGRGNSQWLDAITVRRTDDDGDVIGDPETLRVSEIMVY